MVTVLDVLVSPRALAVGLLLLLLAPGLLLRFLVRAYPCDDPRRSELRAELRAVPRTERPAWVLEQVETVLVDGLRSRARQRRRRRSLRASLRASSEAPVLRAGATAMAVVVLFYLLMGSTFGMGLAVVFVPLVLLFPALPLVLLALLAVSHRRRVRRERARLGR